MDDEREDFLDRVSAIIAEARDRMTPIEREFCDIRCALVMEKARNSFWICYRRGEPGNRILTKEQLQERGREEEIKVLWLLEHGPFSFVK